MSKYFPIYTAFYKGLCDLLKEEWGLLLAALGCHGVHNSDSAYNLDKPIIARVLTVIHGVSEGSPLSPMGAVPRTRS